MVLTFRNVHNWVNGGYAAGVFTAMFAALKPGGILGLVEHRAPKDADLEFMKRSGYVSEPYVIMAARAAGFELLERSEINANPRDEKNHPAGVWSLPPGLRYCRSVEDEAESETCKQQYHAIGESDRMTLKFIKPPT
jgi:predicted methyltransferase